MGGRSQEFDARKPERAGKSFFEVLHPKCLYIFFGAEMSGKFLMHNLRRPSAGLEGVQLAEIAAQLFPSLLQ